MDKKRLKKRKEIAKSCCALFYEKGFNNISVSALAKNAGVAKGSIYEYFSCKEDIILELMCCLQEEYDKNIISQLNSKKSLHQKLQTIFQIFLCDDNQMLIMRDIFKQFLTLTLMTNNINLKRYYNDFRIKYISLINSIINKKEISINLFDEIIMLFLNSLLLEDLNLKDKINNLIEKI